MRLQQLALITLIVASGACAPKVGPARSLVVEKNEALVERGRYLGQHVMACLDCHSTRDWSRYGGPRVPGSEGLGGERYTPEMGFPGTFYAPNITPAALSSWTDGEIERAIAAGLSRDGRPLFPLMPYRSYGQLCQEDLNAVIAWVRTLAPLEGTPPPPPSWSFPFSLIIHNIPKEQQRGACGDPTDAIAYGRYLATAAACADCHTKTDRGRPIPELAFAGGNSFVVPGGTVTSANLTPDMETGLGSWTKEHFVARFKTAEAHEVAPGGPQSLMPWSDYAGMSEQDLGALYDFLRSLKPIRNPVQKWTPTATTSP
jgi:cytochrome c553